jgi:hypothetical protein
VIAGQLSLVARTLLVGVVALTAIQADPPGPPLPAPSFTDGTAISTNEGHATLSWSLDDEPALPGDVSFEVQQSRDAGFRNHRVLHQGPERSLFVSGLNDGSTYFRVRAIRGAATGPWSEPLVVEVDYPGRGQVFLLLGVGCLVFLATVASIATGWMRDRRGQS